MVIYNQNQWAGDYVAAGITVISMDIQSITSPLNSSFSNDLDIRIAIEDTSGNRYGSNTA